MRRLLGPLLALALLAPADARGTCADLAHAAGSRWTTRIEDGVAWLVTPCGARFFSVGINGLNGGAPTPAQDGRIE